MIKLCLALVCVVIGVGGWIGLEGRPSAESSPDTGSYHPGYGGGSPQPPLRLPDQGEEMLEFQETALILGTLIVLAIVVDSVTARSDCAPSVESKNPHGNQPPSAHERAVRPTC